MTSEAIDQILVNLDRGFQSLRLIELLLVFLKLSKLQSFLLLFGLLKGMEEVLYGERCGLLKPK